MHPASRSTYVALAFLTTFLLASTPAFAGTLWVDVAGGNDEFAHLQLSWRPYKTLTAAKAAARGGDTVIVYPGVYDEKNLLKDGVNWHFMAGAVVQYTGSANGGIFDDSATGENATVRSLITGWGEFFRLGSGGSGDVFKIWKPGSKVTAHFYRAGGIARGLAIAGDATTELIAYFDSISTSDGALDCVGGHMVAKGREAICDNIGHENDGGIADITLDLLKGGDQGIYLNTSVAAPSTYHIGRIIAGEIGVMLDVGSALVVSDYIESNTDATIFAGSSGTGLRVKGARIVNTGSSPAVFNSNTNLILQDCILEPGTGAVEVGGSVAPTLLGGRNPMVYVSAQATLANFILLEEAGANAREGDLVKLTSGSVYLLNGKDSAVAAQYELIVP